MNQKKYFISPPIKTITIEGGQIKFTNEPVNMAHVTHYMDEKAPVYDPERTFVYAIKFYLVTGKTVDWWFGEGALSKEKRDWTFHWIESEFSREIPLPSFDNPYGI